MAGSAAALDVVIDANQVYVTGLGNVGISGFLTVVAYDRATGARLWRTDKKPGDCTYAQLEVVPPQELSAIFAGGR